MAKNDSPPKKIGRYEVIDRFGTGSSAYLGQRRRGKQLKDYVLKLLSIDDELAARLQEKVNRCSSLYHPAIQSPEELFKHGADVVLVYRHIEGVGLDRLQRHLISAGERLSDQAVFSIIHDVASALAVAHLAIDQTGKASPILHGHLAPEHVLLTWEGKLQLLGLELVECALSRDQAPEIAPVPGFAAPELVAQGIPTPRSDVYGVVALLWSLLARRLPPDDGAPLRPLFELRPDLDGAILDLVELGLRTDPEERRLDCVTLKKRLADYADLAKGATDLHGQLEVLRALDVLPMLVPSKIPSAPYKTLVSGSSREILAAAGELPDSSKPPSIKPSISKDFSARLKRSVSPTAPSGSPPSPVISSEPPSSLLRDSDLVALLENAVHSALSKRGLDKDSAPPPKKSPEPLRPAVPSFPLRKPTLGVSKPPFLSAPIAGALTSKHPTEPSAEVGRSIIEADRVAKGDDDSPQLEISTAVDDLDYLLDDVDETAGEPLSDELRAAETDGVEPELAGAVVHPSGSRAARVPPPSSPAGVERHLTGGGPDELATTVVVEASPAGAKPEVAIAGGLAATLVVVDGAGGFESEAPEVVVEGDERLATTLVVADGAGEVGEREAPEVIIEGGEQLDVTLVVAGSSTAIDGTKPSGTAVTSQPSPEGMDERTAEPWALSGDSAASPEGAQPHPERQRSPSSERDERTETSGEETSLGDHLPHEEVSATAPHDAGARRRSTVVKWIAMVGVIAAVAFGVGKIVKRSTDVSEHLGTSPVTDTSRSVVQPATEPTTTAPTVAATAPTTTATESIAQAAVPSATSSEAATSASSNATSSQSASSELPSVDMSYDGPEPLSYEGFLIVRSSIDADVYVHGVKAGKTNKKLRTRCRWKNVRLATDPGPRWLGKGVAVEIACIGETTVHIEPE